MSKFDHPKEMIIRNVYTFYWMTNRLPTFDRPSWEIWFEIYLSIDRVMNIYNESIVATLCCRSAYFDKMV